MCCKSYKLFAEQMDTQCELDPDTVTVYDPERSYICPPGDMYREVHQFATSDWKMEIKEISLKRQMNDLF